ncbi:MAG: DUF1857 family protein [Holophagaceae bacterium]|nr:DUF1857 family protein [Holophagaceae bacterium]
MPAHRVSSPVNASSDTVWAVLLDKMEHPQRYIEDALDAEILDRSGGAVVRQLVLPGGVSFRERITADRVTRTITFTLLDHPVYEGTVVNRLRVAPAGGAELIFELDWRPRPGCRDDRSPGELPGLIESSVMHTRRIAEALENRA